MVISKQQSNAFWEIKAFAIFTVFFAHMPVLSDNIPHIAYFFEVAGVVGVPMFMMMSGFFNLHSTTPLGKTFLRLFVPLLIWGSVCFTLHIIKTPTDTIVVDWIKFVMGSKSVFYFVPMLFCCILLVHYVNDWFLLLLGVLSQVLSSLQTLFPYGDVWTVNLNPFNFTVYFCLGRLIRKYWGGRVSYKFLVPICLICSIVFPLFITPSYENPFIVAVAFSVMILTYGLFINYKNKWLIEIGKMSFVIYLCHIQIAGFIQALYRPLWGTWLELTKVFVAFFIVCVFCFALKSVLVQFKLEKVTRYLGFR